MTLCRLSLLGPDGAPIAIEPRRRARASLDQAWPNAYSYDAANVVSQDMSSWLPWLRSPDAEINLFRDRMVSRTRDLVRNDGWAAGGIDRTLDNVIGAQFDLRAEPDFFALSREFPALDATWAAEFAEAVEAEWRMWADDPARWCDGTRVQTVTQMFRLALRHKLIDGDALGVLLWLPENVTPGAGRYATTLQIIDPDRLSNPYEAPDSEHRRGGVELDALGAPIGYHIRRAHQDDWYLAAEFDDLGRGAARDRLGPAHRGARFRARAGGAEPRRLRARPHRVAVPHAHPLRPRGGGSRGPADHHELLHHQPVR